MSDPTPSTGRHHGTPPPPEAPASTLSSRDAPRPRGIDPDELGRFTLFENVRGANLVLLARGFREERHARGTRIFSEGDPGNRLFLVAEGAVRITQRLAGGAEEALAVLHEGQYFGDMSLIDARPRSADAVVEEDARLYSIDRRDFLHLLKRHGDLALEVLFQFLYTLSMRLRESNDKVRALNIMAMW